MSNCEDKFQRIEQLQEQIAGLRASMVDLKADIASKRAEAGIEPMADAVGSEDNAKAIQRGIATEEKTNIPAGNPVNFKQRLRYFPEQAVADYAQISRSLMQVGQKINPEDWTFIRNNPSDVARELNEMTNGKVSVREALRRMADDGDPFAGAAERVARLRWWQEQATGAYIDNTLEIQNFMDTNPNAAVPSDLRARAFGAFKLALTAERHYDHVRNQWAKMGHAMQGNAGARKALDLVDDTSDVLSPRGEEFDPDRANQTLEEAIALKPGDLSLDQSIGRVMKAADLAQSNPAEAAKQLSLEITNLKVQGADPRKRLVGKKYRDAQLRLVNLLAKDHQLFNERTLALNTQSNIHMALVGPYRTMWENMLQRPVGTKFMDHALDAWQANWAGFKAGLDAVRAAGKEAFLDVWNGNEALFANNRETYGKFNEPTAQRVRELEALMNVKGNFLSIVNPERYRRQFHAALRLWLYDKTGHSAALRPGLTAMGATDNVAGMFFHHFHYRTQLEMTARRDGVQMGLFDQRSIDDWVNKEYEEGFYGVDPTERQIIAYRKDRNIPADLMGDTEVAAEIVESRVRANYGAPVPINDLVKKATDFSEEMRFQNQIDPDAVGAAPYNAINSLRRSSYLADAAIPYLQAPFMGAGLDLDLIGIGPTVGVVRHITGQRRLNAAQVRRLKANFILAGHVHIAFLGLSATGAIVGNGPTQYEERQEWLKEMKRQGKKPNSIFGVQLLGGLPVISTLFLMEDIRYNVERSFISKYDQASAADAIVNVLAGHLSRTTSLGQVGQLLDVIYGNENERNRALASMAGYLGGGQVPGIGLIRSTERVLNTRNDQLYADAEITQKDHDLFDQGYLRQAESFLQNLAYGVSGLTGLAGGRYKDKDHLGNPIRLPWGMDLATYWQHRFFPHLHPETAVYKELNMLNLLNPPEPLMTKRLEGVPMSDDLQWEYNETYGSVKGDIDPLAMAKLTGAGTVQMTVRMPIRVTLPSGIQVKKNKDLLSINLGAFLGQHTRGKTYEQAVQSLISSEFYKNMQASEDFTSDPAVRDAAPNVLRAGPARQMQQALISYYHQLTLAKLRTSTTPQAGQWRDDERKLNDQEVLGSRRKVQSFSGVLGGAQ